MRATHNSVLIMIVKRLLRPDRLRQIPKGFSWVDHRLVRHAHLHGCAPNAWALYLFLVTVADAQGLSYYSEAAISRYLSLDLVSLAAARQQLDQAQLIAYRKPLYQVLALPAPSAPTLPTTVRTDQAQSVAEILRRALKGEGA